MRLELTLLAVAVWMLAGCGAPMRAPSDRQQAFARLSNDVDWNMPSSAPIWIPWQDWDLPTGAVPYEPPGATLLSAFEVDALERPPGASQSLPFTRQAQCLAEANLKFMIEHGEPLWEPLATWVRARCGLTGHTVDTRWESGPASTFSEASLDIPVLDAVFSKSVVQVAQASGRTTPTWRPRNAPELDGVDDMVVWPLSIATDSPDLLRDRVEDGFADDIIAMGEACRETRAGQWLCFTVTETIHPRLVFQAWPITTAGDEDIIRGWNADGTRVTSAFVAGPGLPGMECRARHNVDLLEFYIHCPIPPAGQVAVMTVQCVREGGRVVEDCAQLAWPGPDPGSMTWDQAFPGMIPQSPPTWFSRADVESGFAEALIAERNRLGLPSAIHLRAQSEFLSDSIPAMFPYLGYDPSHEREFNLVYDVIGEGWAVPWDIGFVAADVFTGGFASPEHFLQSMVMNPNAGMVAFSPLIDGIAVGIVPVNSQTGEIAVLMVGYQRVDPERLDLAAERVLQEVFRLRSLSGIQGIPDTRPELVTHVATMAERIEAGWDIDAAIRQYYRTPPGNYNWCAFISMADNQGFSPYVYLLDRVMEVGVAMSLVPGTRRYEPWVFGSLYGGCPG